MEVSEFAMTFLRILLVAAVSIALFMFVHKLWLQGQDMQPEVAYSHLKRVEMVLGQQHPLTDFIDTRTIDVNTLNPEMFQSYFKNPGTFQFYFKVFVYDSEGYLLSSVSNEDYMYEFVSDVLEKRSDKYVNIQVSYPVNLINAEQPVGKVVIDYYYRVDE